ncbi:hypothetical protein CTAYLR_004575 [Chrysophaeum taylorii]|uniref:Uncharacterized protein n=1 Tax=Chrysophaeum taylorii TaxID=2483200 RepID=A0AAD7UDH6_9STRA|nr:hypothetical protein CTAYLR_004575 [Chrysophaeum taylorii]
MLLFVASTLSALAPRPAALVPRLATATEVEKQFGDQRLVVLFDCFGFFEQKTLITLSANKSVTYGPGMISEGPGEWRVVEGDPADGEDPDDNFLEFTQPMTMLYRELYNVPGGIVYWRGKVVGDRIEEGVAISESNLKAAFSFRALLAKLQGIRFQKEGTFTADLVTDETDPASLPQPVRLDLFDPPPDGDEDEEEDKKGYRVALSAPSKRRKKKQQQGADDDDGGGGNSGGTAAEDKSGGGGGGGASSSSSLSQKKKGFAASPPSSD